ncbi:redoxin domain-containing protein [Phenylobacterium deserti]|uniref:TlpA family protein disulfide reductase n=1 Tax=Phenylobacterium deserti TaxID=1914756 RepID=A0A328ADS3_9CAUL|nr:redoxin domain-containing protein [Phenylobacterium deserti]RAK52725.1 TlpA family protein disulfide reductase [Phenylobacterium deserti]
MTDPAPPLVTTRWFNTPETIDLERLRGRVVALYAFQMLCPGCVAHALPQAMRLREAFGSDDLAVLGLHTVFEHHAANSPGALAAFLHEYRIGLPVGLDAAAASGPIPRTMAAYGMRGTPTLVLIDRRGDRRRQVFGHLPDLALGTAVAGLVRGDPAGAAVPATATADTTLQGCEEGRCAIPGA